MNPLMLMIMLDGSEPSGGEPAPTPGEPAPFTMPILFLLILRFWRGRR